MWRTALRVQSFYYISTGLWPLIHISSFTRVSGPKTDIWLVKTVGALVLMIGINLLLAAREKSWSLESFLLAFGSALSLAAIDVIYVSNATIAPIYLGDAVVEVGMALWICWMRMRPQGVNRF